jgi:hypothetical protein
VGGALLQVATAVHRQLPSTGELEGGGDTGGRVAVATVAVCGVDAQAVLICQVRSPGPA